MSQEKAYKLDALRLRERKLDREIEFLTKQRHRIADEIEALLPPPSPNGFVARLNRGTARLLFDVYSEGH